MMTKFIKMHGIGNDFVILDARKNNIILNKQELTKIANRRMGIGCDQIVILQHSSNADVKIEIYNSDGSKAQSCGNATRCVASLLELKSGNIEVADRILSFQKTGQEYAINMGKPKTVKEIPLSTLIKNLNSKKLSNALIRIIFIDIGNPHLVFFLNEKLTSEEISFLGPYYENHELFADRVNVNFAYIASPTNILLNVWERGAGITLACGSGACASAYAAYKASYIAKESTIFLPGGNLEISITAQDEIIMKGPAEKSFEGEIIINTISL